MIDLGKRSAWTLIISGVIAIVVGVLALAWPGSSALVLTRIFGWYALVDGIVQLVFGLRLRSSGMKWFLVVVGALGIVAGLTVIFRPVASTVAIAMITGIWLVIRGGLEIVSALGAGRAGSRLMTALAGVLFIIAGVLFMMNPIAAALTITTWIGILTLLWGVLTLGAGIAVRTRVSEESPRA